MPTATTLQRLLLFAALIALLPTIQATAQQVPPGPQALDGRAFTGKAADDQFGHSVASAGDVNGDGYDDIIVGAFFNDASAADAGAAYIYFGGKIQDLIADVTFTGAAAADQFGRAVASAGDVNGDGYDDVIIGAILNDASAADAGAAYIYFGGAAMDNTPDLTLFGEAAGDQFGRAVASAGDANGDGYSDVVVGAYRNNTVTGRAYVFYGGAAMDNTPDVTLNGEAAEDRFGFRASGAGDVNGDGYSDVIVGAYLNDGAGSNVGRAYVFYGGAAMDNTPDVTLDGEAAGDSFGRSVAGAGDVNGDGYGDVVVGAFENDAAGTNAGRAYIFYGGASMDNAADVTMTAAAAGDNFGIESGGAGDVNGDGYGDVIVGAPGNDAAGVDAGRAYVYWGGAAMDAVADILLTGEALLDTFGGAVASAGDVNGDGYSDFLVGAPGNDVNGSGAGRAYLYLNSLTGNDLTDAFFTGEAIQDQFGGAVASAGDVNGDGYDDLIVGAQSSDGGGDTSGRAYIYFGGPMLDTIADVTMTGEGVGDYFGRSVSGAGDVNGDGYDDVIVGASGNDTGGTGAGRAYVFYGGAAMDNIPDVTMTGLAADDFLGTSVASAGDVNGDGYVDIIVGASESDVSGTDGGQAYVFYGGAAMDNTPDVTLYAEAAEDRFGGSVSGAGDVNGDGYSDVIVGAYAGGTPNNGRAYLYFGSPAMNSSVDVTFTGEQINDQLGLSVSGAGDVNGDGYSDVIVGAPNADQAYVYYGGAIMDNTADVTMTAGGPSQGYANNVSGAGDVNGDGYADVIVGASSAPTFSGPPGQAYLYYGGSAMDNLIDVTMTGEAANDAFGVSAAPAGDLNQDGYGDVIIGAWTNDAGGTNAGRAYLHLSSAPAIVPRITGIQDITGDQGGFVHVDWTRSGYDAAGINRVTSYLIERSRPPGTGGFFWEEVAIVTARQNPGYSIAAPTYSDQTEGNAGTTFFRVTALTGHPDEFWRSMNASGASIDNLAPFTPQNPDIEQTAPETITLGWDENTTDPDVFGYTVYRSTTDGFSIHPDNLLAQTTSISYADDTATGSQPYFYRLTTKDVHGNESPPTDQLTALTYVNLKVFLEGPYQTGGTLRTDLLTADLIPLEQPYGTVEYLDTPSAYTGEEMVTTLPPGAVDWVLVEIRSGTAGVDSLTTRAALLMQDGRIRDLDGSGSLAFGSLAEGSYYVVVRHRNHLAVMSSMPVLISVTVPSLYDFTTSASQAFGTSAMTEVEAGVWALYSGDGDASGGVTASDQALWLSENGLNGYQVGDYNLSGGATASDQALWLSGNGLNSQVPE